MKNNWWKILLVLIAVFGLWYLAPLDEWVKSLNQWVESQGALGWIVFGLVYIVATALMIPGSILTLAAGLVFGLAGAPLVIVSATIGACLAFLISRYLLRDKVEAKTRDNAKFKAVDEAVGEEGWKIVGLLRLSPLVPFNLQNYLFGVTRVGFWPYALATFFGIMPGTIMYVYLGAAGRAALGSEEGSGLSTPQIALFVVGLVATIIVAVIISRKAKARLKNDSVIDSE